MFDPLLLHFPRLTSFRCAGKCFVSILPRRTAGVIAARRYRPHKTNPADAARGVLSGRLRLRPLVAMRATVLLVRTVLTAALVLRLLRMSAGAAVATPMGAVVRGFARASALSAMMGLRLSTR